MAQLFDDLISRSLLPTTSEDRYKSYSLKGSVHACGQDDTKLRRILVNPSESAVYLPALKDVSATTTFQNIDDSLYRRILTAKEGFQYELTDKKGQPTGGKSVLHLCRSDSPISGSGAAGRYELYVTNNPILENAPKHPGMDQLTGLQLSDAEIVNLVRGSGLMDSSQYAVSQDSIGIFLIAHNRTLVLNLVGWLENNPKARALFPDKKRREEIMSVLKRNIEADGFQFDSLKFSANWQPYLAAATLLSIPLMIVAQKYLMDQMRSEGVKFDISKVMKDRTDGFKTDDPESIDTRGQERYVRDIRNGLNRSGYPHVLISGPSGSGKSHSVETAARLIVNGLLKTKLPSGVHYVQVDAGKIVTEAGAWQNGAKTVFGRVLDALGKEPTIVHLLESDRFANAGTEGNSKVNLLPELYSIMEQKTPRDANLFFILDSTRYQTIYEAAPDLARRMYFTEVIPQTPDVIRNAMDVGIALRLKSDVPTTRQSFERIRFSSGALDAIAALGDYRDGAPPSSHLSLLDEIVSEAEDARPEGSFTIEAEHVFRKVARDTRQTTEAVRSEYQRRMAPGGFQGNTVIQESLLKGFYKAYPEPRGGILDPLNLPPEADAKSSIFDADAPPSAVAKPAANPLTEVMNSAVNSAAIESSLKTDPVLTEFYRSRFGSGSLMPATTFAEVARGIVALDPTILRQSNQAVVAEGLSLTQAPERFLFEMITRAAAAHGGWTPSNPTELPARAASFEADVRRAGGVKPGVSTAAETARREAEERARLEAEARSGKP